MRGAASLIRGRPPSSSGLRPHPLCVPIRSQLIHNQSCSKLIKPSSASCLQQYSTIDRRSVQDENTAHTQQEESVEPGLQRTERTSRTLQVDTSGLFQHKCVISFTLHSESAVADFLFSLVTPMQRTAVVLPPSLQRRPS